MNKRQQKILDWLIADVMIGRDVDGYDYFVYDGGILPAKVLRDIADVLDYKNKPWHDQVTEAMLKPKPDPEI